MAQPQDDLAPDPDLPKGPAGKIVRTKDQPAWQDGFRFLEEAKRIHASERERGYAEGLAEGGAEASRLVAETAAGIDRYLATLDKQVAGLALDIVRRILGEFDHAELVARAAALAVADFRRDKALKITVHPSAEVHVRDFLASYSLPSSLAVSVEGDPALGPMDCLLSSDSVTVNASIETQLHAIARAFGLTDGARTP